MATFVTQCLHKQSEDDVPGTYSRFMEVRPPIRFLGDTRLPSSGSVDLAQRMGHQPPPPPVDSLEIGAGDLGREWRSAGLGLVNPPGSTQQVEANKPNATMAIIDGFGPGAGFHGESTSAMARAASGGNEENVLRLSRSFNPSAPSLSRLPSEGFGAGLDHYMQRTYIDFSNSTRESLQNIRTHQPRIRDVSHSQGVNGPGLTQELLSQAESDPAFARNLARELGLPESTTNWVGNPQAELAAARRVQRGLSGSQQVQSAQEQLAAEIERGRGSYTYFNSAGNDGRIQRRLAAQGFQFEPRWAGNVQAASGATRSVAAADMRPGPLGAEGVSAPYTQVRPNSVAAAGANRATLGGELFLGQQGTSFATPFVAGTHNRNPRGYERMLRSTIPSMDNNLGAGMVL